MLNLKVVFAGANWAVGVALIVGHLSRGLFWLDRLVSGARCLSTPIAEQFADEALRRDARRSLKYSTKSVVA